MEPPCRRVQLSPGELSAGTDASSSTLPINTSVKSLVIHPTMPVFGGE